MKTNYRYQVIGRRPDNREFVFKSFIGYKCADKYMRKLADMPDYIYYIMGECKSIEIKNISGNYPTYEDEIKL